MAKKTDNTILYVAGAAGLAYLILSKKPTPPAIPGQPAPPTNLLADSLSLVKNLFVKQSPPAQNSDIIAIEPPVSNPAPVPINFSQITNEDLLRYDQESIAGFTEIPGTALAVLCGCAACAKPLNAIGKTNFDWKSLIVPGVVLAGGYLIAKNLGLLGGASAENNQAIEKATQAANQQSLNAALAGGSRKSLPDAQYNSLALDIFNQGQTYIGSISGRAMDAIVADFLPIKTTADLFALKVAFGTRNVSTSFWSTCNWLNFNCPVLDLDSFIKAAIDQEHLNQINSYLAAQGIQYTF